MKTLKHIFVRYSAFLWAVLKPLGLWGVFGVAALDGSLIGLPIDALVAGYVYGDPKRFLLYVLVAAAGSMLGSIVIYGIGYAGGEELVRKRISAARFEKIHSSFEKHPFWALMFPAMLPPPTPFKLFELAAAASEMKFSRYLLAIFAGRMVRFLALSALTMKFGPDVVRLFGQLFRQPLYLISGLVALAVLGWLLHRRRAASEKGVDRSLGPTARDEARRAS